MFPNIRLMIVAMGASLAAIACAMGLFATFRVNHDPLLRLQAGNPTPQLVLSDNAAPPPTDGAAVPFGVRFPVNAPLARGAAVAVPIFKLDDEGSRLRPGGAALPMAPVMAYAPIDQGDMEADWPDAAPIGEPSTSASRDLGPEILTPDMVGAAAPIAQASAPAAAVKKDAQDVLGNGLGADAKAQADAASEVPETSQPPTSALPDHPLESDAKILEKTPERPRSDQEATKAKTAGKSTSRLARGRTARRRAARSASRQDRQDRNDAAAPSFRSASAYSAPGSTVSSAPPQPPAYFGAAKRTRHSTKAAAEATATQSDVTNLRRGTANP